MRINRLSDGVGHLLPKCISELYCNNNPTMIKSISTAQPIHDRSPLFFPALSFVLTADANCSCPLFFCQSHLTTGLYCTLSSILSWLSLTIILNHVPLAPTFFVFPRNTQQHGHHNYRLLTEKTRTVMNLQKPSVGGGGSK